MADDDDYRCRLCGAAFSDSRGLTEHEKARHAKSASGAAPSNEDSEKGEQERKDRRFERSNWE